MKVKNDFRDLDRIPAPYGRREGSCQWRSPAAAIFFQNLTKLCKRTWQIRNAPLRG
jgi:hypothetical protein